MKALKKILVLFIFLFILPVLVQAGSIRFNEPEKVSNTSYKFTLTIQDMELNHISGKISITNGTISNIVMSSGWMSKTGNNNQFYFYHNGASTGNYTIATIYVTMTGDSEYRISDVDYGVFKCSKDVYGTYFGSLGEVVSESTFQSVCGKSKDATLKSLSISSGTLSPSFSPSLEIYSATVENSIHAVTFYPTTNHSKAKVLSGINCALNVGLNTCKIVVQAESGDTKTYSITVLRKGNSGGWQLSSDASIRDLKVHNGTLTSPFSLSKTEYDVKVSKDTHQIYFSFVMNSNGQPMKSDACGITPDTSKCKLTVTAEDGVSTKTYTFNILHEGKENNGNGNTNNENNVSVVKPTNPSSGSSSSTSSSNPSSVENNPSNSNPSHSTSTNNDTQKDNNVENKENSNLQESEEHYYSENPKEDVISIPIIDKEIKVSTFYQMMAVGTLILGAVFGYILAKILKKVVQKNNKSKE